MVEETFGTEQGVRTELINKMADVETAARRGRTYEWMLNKSALLQAKTVQWSAAKINLNIFSMKDVGVTAAERTVTEVKLFGKNHQFLRIQDDGSVSGTRGQKNDEGKVKRITGNFAKSSRDESINSNHRKEIHDVVPGPTTCVMM